MKTLTKISAVALLTFLLAACDKPATDAKSVVNETATTQPPEVQADPAAEFKQFVAWQAEQEKAQLEAQNTFQKQLSETKDPKELGPIFAAFEERINTVVKSLEQLNFKSDEMKVLVAKIKQALNSTVLLLGESFKAIGSEDPEVKKAFEEKRQAAIQLGAEAQQLQAELQQKYGEKPATPAQ